MLSAILATLWILSLIYAQKREDKKRGMKWTDDPISDYIQNSKVLSVGFILLALAMAIAGLTYGALIAYALGAIGCLIVVATRTIWYGHNTIHSIGAGMAYGGPIVGAILVASNPFLAGAAWSVLALVGFTFLIRDEMGDKERLIALGLVGWLWLAAFML